MQKIASVGLLFGVLTFMPSDARCDLAVPYYPIPIETISGTVVDQSQNLTNYTTGFLDVVAILAQTFTVGRIKRDSDYPQCLYPNHIEPIGDFTRCPHFHDSRERSSRSGKLVWDLDILRLQ
jgi:hypothetical protein